MSTTFGREASMEAKMDTNKSHAITRLLVLIVIILFYRDVTRRGVHLGVARANGFGELWVIVRFAVPLLKMVFGRYPRLIHFKSI